MTEDKKLGCKIQHVDGPWINLRSKSHLGRVYYFNTVTGEAVWNLAEYEATKKNSSGSQSQDSQSISSNEGIYIKSPDYIEKINYDTKKSDFVIPTMNGEDHNNTSLSYKVPQTILPLSYNPNIWDVPPPIFFEPPAINNQAFNNISNTNNLLSNNLSNQNNINATKLFDQTGNINNFSNQPLLIGNLAGQQFLNPNRLVNNCNHSHNLVNQSSNFFSNQQLLRPNPFSFNMNNLSDQTMTNINNVPIVNNLANQSFTNQNDVINPITDINVLPQHDSNTIFNPTLQINQFPQDIKTNTDDNLNVEFVNSRNTLDLLSNRFKLMSDSRIDSNPRIVKPYRRKSICIEVSDMPVVPRKKPILNANDLRFKLSAKKTSETMEPSHSDSEIELNEGCMNSNFQKQNVIATQENKSSESEGENQYSHNEDEEERLPKLDVSPLKRLAKPAVRTDRWYFVADTNVLMSNLTFVNILIKSDPTCRMMVPYQVHSELDSYANRPANKNAYTMARRATHYLARELKSKTSVMGQSALKAIDIKINRSSGDDDIINCCLQLIEQDYHVILLTNDVILNTKAEATNIATFSIKQIKDYLYSRQDEKSQYKVTIQNKNAESTDTNQWCFEKYLSGFINVVDDISSKQNLNIVSNKTGNYQIDKTTTQIKNTKNNTDYNDSKKERINVVTEINNKNSIILNKKKIEQNKITQENNKIASAQQSTNTIKTKLNLTVINPSPINSKPIKLKRMTTKKQSNDSDTIVDDNIPKFRWRRKSQNDDKNKTLTNNKNTISINGSKIEDFTITKTNIQAKPNPSEQKHDTSLKNNNKIKCSIPFKNIVKFSKNITSKQVISDRKQLTKKKINFDIKNSDVTKSCSDILCDNKINNVHFNLKPVKQKVTFAMDYDKNSLNKQVEDEPKNVIIPNKEILGNLQISLNLSKGSKQIVMTNDNNNQIDNKTMKPNIITSPLQKICDKPLIEDTDLNVDMENIDLKEDSNESEIVMKSNNTNEDTSHKYSDIFDIKDEILGERLKSRSDEWIFRFSQIMEEILSQLLQQNFSDILKSTMPPPWTVHEATECIKQVLNHKFKVKQAATKLSLSIFKNSDKSGNLIIGMQPREYMKLYNQGVALIKSLKEVYPKNEDIVIAETLLSKLIMDIRDINNSNYKCIETTSMDNFMETSSIVCSPLKKTIESKTNENVSPNQDDITNQTIEEDDRYTIEGSIANEDNINVFKFIRTCNVDPSTFKKNTSVHKDHTMINTEKDSVNNDQIEDFIQIFINQVKNTLLDVHNFCKNTTAQLEDEKNIDHLEIRSKVDTVKLDTEKILDYLQRILNRETHGSEETLSTLLPTSMLADHHSFASKYREIIKKCTVQAKILLDTLNVILTTF